MGKDKVTILPRGYPEGSVDYNGHPIDSDERPIHIPPIKARGVDGRRTLSAIGMGRFVPDDPDNLGVGEFHSTPLDPI